jgi:uncharacterized membrane protein YvlD (DUF360 family)
MTPIAEKFIRKLKPWQMITLGLFSFGISYICMNSVEGFMGGFITGITLPTGIFFVLYPIYPWLVIKV